MRKSFGRVSSMTTAQTNETLTIRQAADILDMDVRTIAQLLVDGTISCRSNDEDVLVIDDESLIGQRWHRTKHLARALGVSPNRIRERIDRGEIEATRFGVEWRIGDKAFKQATSHTQ